MRFGPASSVAAAVTAALVALSLCASAATTDGSIDLIIKQGSGHATVELVDALLKHAPAGTPPRVVDLSGDFSTDVARVSRAAEGASHLFAIGPNATVLAGTVAESSRNLKVIALAVPNPERLKTRATFISFYPKLDEVMRFVTSRYQARRVGFLYSPTQNAAAATAFGEAAAARGITLRPIETRSTGDLVRNLKESLLSVDLLLLPVDPLLFDRERMELIVEQANAAEKPMLGFLADLPALGITGALVTSRDSIARAAWKARQRTADTGTIDVEGSLVYITADRESAVTLDAEKGSDPKTRK